MILQFGLLMVGLNLINSEDSVTTKAKFQSTTFYLPSVVNSTDAPSLGNATTTTGHCSDENAVQRSIISSVMKNYEKQSLPTGGREAITALVEMHINDIPSLSELNSDFILDLMYSEMWRDSRLQFQNLPLGQCISNITLGILSAFCGKLEIVFFSKRAQRGFLEILQSLE